MPANACFLLELPDLTLSYLFIVSSVDTGGYQFHLQHTSDMHFDNIAVVQYIVAFDDGAVVNRFAPNLSEF